MGINIPLQYTEWLPCWRIIPSRFPPISLFERVATSEEFEVIYEIEQLTNPRLRDEVGDIQLVPPHERIFGIGTSQIMAAFTHLNPQGSRFSNGTFGVYYAAYQLETALIETKYHREKFFRDFHSPKTEIDMRVLVADLKATLHDLSAMRQDKLLDVLDPNSYSASQALAKQLRNADINSYGILYNSVRDQQKPKGKCAAIFKPKALSNCRQERHLCYIWDGEKISHIYRKSSEPCSIT